MKLSNLQIFKFTNLLLLLSSCNPNYDLAGFLNGTSPEVSTRFEQSIAYNDSVGVPAVIVPSADYRVYVCTDSHIDSIPTNLTTFVQAAAADTLCPLLLHLGDLVNAQGHIPYAVSLLQDPPLPLLQREGESLAPIVEGNLSPLPLCRGSRRGSCFLLCCLLLAGVAGCDPAVKMAGEYSYKLSGKVTIDSTDYTLSNEQGTMDMLRKTDGDMLLTFSQLRGGVYTAEAEINDTLLTLYPFERTVSIVFTVPDTTFVLGDTIVRDKEVTETFDVEVTGVGTLYKETIVFDLYFNGESQESDAHLTGDNILMVAKKN